MGGTGILDGLEVSIPERRSAVEVFVSDMSNTGNLALGDYIKGLSSWEWTRWTWWRATGYVSQSRHSGEGGLFKITPGVHSKVSEGNIYSLLDFKKTFNIHHKI